MIGKRAERLTDLALLGAALLLAGALWAWALARKPAPAASAPGPALAVPAPTGPAASTPPPTGEIWTRSERGIPPGRTLFAPPRSPETPPPAPAVLKKETPLPPASPPAPFRLRYAGYVGRAGDYAALLTTEDGETRSLRPGRRWAEQAVVLVKLEVGLSQGDADESQVVAVRAWVRDERSGETFTLTDQAPVATHRPARG